MAKQPSEKKVRRLRAPVTMRERAAKSQQAKPSRLPSLKPLTKPFGVFGRFRRIPVWRPLKIAGRIIGKILVPPYIRSSFRELRQVTWPNRSQTLELTGAVIVFSVIFGVIVAIVDFGLDKLFKQVILR